MRTIILVTISILFLGCSINEEEWAAIKAEEIEVWMEEEIVFYNSADPKEHLEKCLNMGRPEFFVFVNSINHQIDVPGLNNNLIEKYLDTNIAKDNLFHVDSVTDGIFGESLELHDQLRESKLIYAEAANLLVLDNIDSILCQQVAGGDATR